MSQRAEGSPHRELSAIRRRMNDLFESALARSDFDAEAPLDAWAPAGDAHTAGDRFVVFLELPGVEPAAVEVRIEGADLVIDGQREIDHEQAGGRFHRIERSYGRFARRFRLPASAEPGDVTATFRAGVLRIEVPLRGPGRSATVHVPIE